MNSVDFSSIFAASPTPYLLIAPDDRWTLIAANEAYFATTMTTPAQLIGRALFEIFPVNPDDPAGDGVATIHGSLAQVVRTRVQHAMAVFRFDIRRRDGQFEEHYWSTVNTPILAADGSITCILNQTQDVTDYVRLKLSGIALQQSNQELREQSGRKHVEATVASLRLHESERRLQESTLRIAEFEQRQVAEAALREVAAKLEHQTRTFDYIASTTLDFLYIFRLDGRFLYANRRLLEVWGVTLEQAVGKSLIELGYPQWHAEMHLREIRQVIETKQPIKGEVPFTGGSGISGVYEYIFTPVIGPDGNVEVIAGTTRDVTERRQAEAAVRDAEQRYRTVFESSRDAKIIYNLEGTILEVNPAACQMYGYTASEMVGMHAPNSVHPAARAMFEDFRKVAGAGGIFSGETFAPRRDGTAFPIEVLGTSFQYKGQTQLMSVIRDVTERKQSEAALRESEERLRLGLDAGAVGTWDWDIPTNKVTWSDRVYEFHGLKAGEFGGRVEDFGRMIHPEDAGRIDSAIKASVRDGTPYDVEFRVVHPTGAIHWLATSGKVYYGPDGQPLRMVGATTDVTSRRLATEEREHLLAAERTARSEAERVSRMKDEFLATLSHELRTPLNAILGWSQILAEGGRDSNDLTEGLRIISRNAKAQTQIIEDLLDMSRIISGKIRLDVQRVNLSAVLRDAIETIQPAADAKGVRLVTTVDSRADSVRGDASRLQQVLWNLLSNAVKFTPRGGHIQVIVERVESQVQISVADTGEGIRAEFLPYVFDRFSQSDASTTRRHGGLGLGLAIAKQLLELHGGSIRVASPGAGQGTKFTISLPQVAIQEPADVPLDRGSSPTAVTGLELEDCADIAGVKVLVVDDEADARNLVRRLLEDCRAVVAVAASAEEAVNHIRQERPDVLVSDIGMPGVDGYALMRRVRKLPAEQGGRTPAIALTAYARAEDRMKSVVAGYQHHVAKPVEAAELITLVYTLARA